MDNTSRTDLHASAIQAVTGWPDWMVNAYIFQQHRLNLLYAPKVIPVTTFLNGWGNYNAIQIAHFWKLGKQVFIQGRISGGTVGLPAFTLPTGYLPDIKYIDGLRRSLPAEVSGGVSGYYDVDSLGNVIPQTPASSTYIFLDGGTFLTA